jgi:type IV secretion system protein VirB4
MIWPAVLSTLIVAGFAGALAVPATRGLVFGSIRHDWLQDELDLDRVEPDGRTVRGKDGSVTRIWRLRGTSYDARVEQEQQTFLLGRAGTLHELGKKGLALRLVGLKRRRPLDCTAEWPHPTLTEIGAAEAARYQHSYEIEWFLIATGWSVQGLVDAETLIASRLSMYAPEAVERPEEQSAPCPLSRILNGLTCGEYRHNLPVRSQNLSGTLPGADLQFDRDGLLTTQGEESSVHRIIGIREWPEGVSGRLIGEIMALNGDLEITQVCEPFDRDKATFLYKREQQAQRTALLGNAELADEIEVMLDLLAKGNTTIFATQFQIICRAADQDELNDLVKQVCEILGNRRVIYSVETVGAPLSWFCRLPRAIQRKAISAGGKLLRPLTLRDENIAALWPLHYAPRGLETSPFGKQPVRWFQTPTGQAYAFQFHVKDADQALGNYLIFAPSGGGKSTLLMYLLGGLAKFDGVRSFIFDSKEGARFMVEAMGGVYQSYDRLALNPLDVGDETAQNRNRVYAILRALCGNLDLTSEDKDALKHAVDLTFQLPPEERSLSEIYSAAFSRRSDLRRHMAQWVVDDKGNQGLHAHVFNAPRDSLGSVLDHYMVAINMNEALDDPELGPPVVAHIASAIGKSAASKSRGFSIFVDEAAKLLQNKGFLDLGVEMFREYRKLGGSVGMAFQDPAALYHTGRAEAFIDNTATLIFLPNANARPETFEPFGLNDEQLDFALGRSVTAGRRQALVVKREAASGFDESAILDIDLSYLGNALRFFRAGTEANKTLETLQAAWGDQWHRHL